jgi:hypothetical protein
MAATFTSQLQDLDQHCPDASKLLRVVAFFDPESIPLEMLTTGAKAIAEAQEPPTRSSSTASLLALILSPIARQNTISHLQTRCLVTHLGSQHPDTLTATYSLACVCAAQGRYKDAEDLLVRVLAARERILGLSHPHTQRTATQLAWVYKNLGRLDEAGMLRQRILPSS